jgi:hypothetical protein
MKQNHSTPKSDALYDYLQDQSTAAGPVSLEEEANLVDKLIASANDIQADPIFQTKLENLLLESIQEKRAPRPSYFSRFTWAFIWIVLVIAFLFGMRWAVQNLIPRFTPLSADTVTQAGPSITKPITQPILATEVTPPTIVVSTPTPSSEIFTSPLLPGDEISIQAELPDTPESAKVYLQVTGPSTDVETARAIAARLGVIGSVYKIPGDNPGVPFYTVTDGIGQITFQYTPNKYYYVADKVANQSVSSQRSLSPEETTKTEMYLNEQKLLDFAFRMETPLVHPQRRISFLQLLDGHPVRYSYSNFDAPQLSVYLNEQGRIETIDSNLLSYQDLGEYPIRSAEEAWEKTVSGEPGLGVELNTLQQIQPSTLKSWGREYPIGKRVELFGIFEMLQPAESGISPYVSFNGYPVSGNQEKLLQTMKPGEFMQVWGQFQVGDKGQKILSLEDWQISTLSNQWFEGTILRKEDQGYLQTADRELLIPELPEDVPESASVSMKAVIKNKAQPYLEWSIITTGQGGGGGGGGGPTFHELNLEGTSQTQIAATATATTIPSILPGESIEGVKGSLLLLEHKYIDGSSNLEANFSIDPNDKWPDGLSVQLEGPGLSGIEAYNGLAVEIWGVCSDNTGDVPTITIDRFEPAYPGITFQAWLGSIESIKLENQNVLRFTAHDGSQFIMGYSIDQEIDHFPTGRIVIEGVTYPDDKFGGYPVITMTDMSDAQGRKDMSDYQIHSGTPYTVKEHSKSATSPGKVIIEKVELVYYTHMADLAAPQEDLPPYIQPVWQFSGRYEDGTLFEILVQALLDQYLK